MRRLPQCAGSTHMRPVILLLLAARTTPLAVGPRRGPARQAPRASLVPSGASSLLFSLGFIFTSGSPSAASEERYYRVPAAQLRPAWLWDSEVRDWRQHATLPEPPVAHALCCTCSGI